MKIFILAAILFASCTASPYETRYASHYNYQVAHEVPIKKPEQAEKELLHTVIAEETPVKYEAKHDIHHEDVKDPRYHGELGYHIPVIKNGVPLDTVSVQVARAEHLAVVAKAEKDDHEPKKAEDDHKGYNYAQAVYLNLDEKEPQLHNLYKREIHEKEQLYNGELGYHIPVIKYGVPANTVAVQIARDEHFAAVAKAEGDEHKHEKHDDHETKYAQVVYLNKHEKEPKLHNLYKRDIHDHNNEKEQLYNGEYGYHIPVIKNGVPANTVSVQIARAEHAAAVAKAEGDEHKHEKHDDHETKYAQVVYLNKHEKEPKLHNLYKREIHEHNNEKEQLYNGEYGYHIPVIKNGVPANTVSVQIARAEHAAAVAKEEGDEHKAEKHEEETEYAKVVFLNKDEKEPKLHLLYKRSAGEFYDGKHGYHYPTIKNGVPVDTAEVQHARAAHLAKLHAEEANNHDDEHYHEDDHHDYTYQHHEKAPLGKDGRVVDTPEVAHAKAEHYAAIAKAGGYATGYDYSDDHYAHDYKHEDHSDYHYDGKYGYHYPTIKNGVPVDTAEVQHARAAHLAKLHHSH